MQDFVHQPYLPHLQKLWPYLQSRRLKKGLSLIYSMALPLGPLRDMQG